MTKFLAVAAFLSLSLPAVSHSQCTDAEKARLEALDKDWTTAGQKGDRVALDNIYSNSYSTIGIVMRTGKATTIDNTMTDASQPVTSPQSTSAPDRYVIVCSPSTATIVHRVTTKSPSGAVTYSRAVHFLEKKGDRWQVVSGTGFPLNDQQQLLYLELDWNDATRRHDAAWLESNYAPFATEVSSRTGLLENKAALIASAKADKTAFDALDLSDVNVRVEGDAAVVTGINRVRGKDGDGKPFDRKIRFTDTFIKRDGKWQVWATQGTTIQ